MLPCFAILLASRRARWGPESGCDLAADPLACVVGAEAVVAVAVAGSPSQRAELVPAAQSLVVVSTTGVAAVAVAAVADESWFVCSLP